MPTIHFYDAITAGKNAAEGQLVRYHSALVSDTTDPIAVQIEVKLRDDVFVDPNSAVDSEIATLDLNGGITELEWARTAFQHFTIKDCLHVGLGTSTKIDPYIRHGIYRSLLPYPCIGLPPQSHFLDLDTLLRTISVLRPEEYPWPNGPTPSTPAALHHFLMWEPNASGLNRALRIKEIFSEISTASPKLIEHAIKLSSVESIKHTLGLDGGEVSDLASVKPCLMVHPSIPNVRGAILAIPVAVDITYPDVVFVVDLESDLGALCDPDTVSLQGMVRVKPSDLNKPLVRVSLSRGPFCAPVAVVRPQDAKRMAVDLRIVKSNIERIRAATHLAARLRDEPILELASQPVDVDHRMWAGDFPPTDLTLMKQLHDAPVGLWPSLIASGVDRRFQDLGLRLLAREQPDILPAAERQLWVSHSRVRAAGNFLVPDRLAQLRKLAEDSSLTFPSAVGLSQLNMRLARLLG